MVEDSIPRIFSSNRRDRRVARAKTLHRLRSDPANWLVEAMAEDAIERIGFMRLAPARALLLGRGTQAVAAALGPDCEIVAPESVADEQPLPWSDVDLAVSLGRLDTANDLPGALLHLRRSLAPGGIMIAAMVGAGSLPVLRRIMLAADGERAAPRIHPQVDNRAATMLLERAGFARLVVDGYGLDVRYPSLTRLVADLREQGLSSALARPGPPIGKSGLRRAEEAFASMAGEDGKVIEHFELLTLTGWNS